MAQKNNPDKDTRIEIDSADALRWIIDFNQTLLSTIPFGIGIVDEEGNILFVNKMLEKISAKDIVGDKCWQYYKDDKEQCTICPLKKKTKKGEIGSFEVCGMFGGKTFQITYAGMLYDGKKAVLEVFEDISIRKEAEESLKETVDMKSGFVSMVSHELRTPLEVISESINVIKGAGELNKKQTRFLDMIKRSANRLTKLVTGVLDFQKMDSGKETFQITRTDINDIVREGHETLQLSAEQKGLTLSLETDNNILPVRADRDKIVQVMVNLINNAVKYTDKGQITVSAVKEDGNAKVSVRDTGTGISKEDLPKLFRSFERLAYNKPGTGLGLAISKKIIERHNGKIWAESEPGKGTVFSFTLPLDQSDGD